MNESSMNHKPRYNRDNKYRDNKYRDNKYKVNPNEQLLLICKTFLEKQNYENDEIEIRFATRGIKSLTRIDYDNVVKKLKSLGFDSANYAGIYSLKIETEILDLYTGQFKSSNVRVEINGLTAIQEYCKTNDINIVIQKHNSSITIMKKGPILINDNRIESADFDDYNFRVSYSNEEPISLTSQLAKNIFDNWLKVKKSFRYINRVSFQKHGIPFRMDLSIVTSSDKERGRYIKTYNINESNVFNNSETYEIESELINYEARLEYKTPQEMKRGFEQISKNVLSGLQRTNYPISYKEQQYILTEYMQLTQGEKFQPGKPVYPSDFIGPSSVTLQIKNIVPINPNMNVPNIRKDYVVTDKADGERNLFL